MPGWASSARYRRPTPEQSPACGAPLGRLEIEWGDDVGYAERVRHLRPDSPPRAALLSQAAGGFRGAATSPSPMTRHPPTHNFAIASTYAHVTAPLRRLCDRFANEIVVAHCADRSPPTWAMEALDDLPALMGTASQRDRLLERAVVDYVEAVVLEREVGKEFSAVVTDVDHGAGAVACNFGIRRGRSTSCGRSDPW